MKNLISILITLLVVLPNSYAQNRCEALFLKDIADIVESENITTWEKNYLQTNLNLIPTNDAQIFVVFQKMIANWGNPYSRSYDFRLDSLKYQLDPMKDFYLLERYFMNAKNNQVLADFLNEWINTEYRAVLVYDLFNQIGMNKYHEVFEFLLEQNVFYMDSDIYVNAKNKKNIITYAFEKEGNKSEISYYFRPPTIKESDWLKLSDNERIQALQNSKLPEKEFVNAETLSPTQLKPSFIGGFSLEWSGIVGQKGWSWEIAHKNYEISRQAIKDQIKEITQFFDETHSIHVHLVFEIPYQYEKYSEFIQWFKILNDFLYLKGMEEGLHGNELTHILNLPEKMSKKELFLDYLQGLTQPANVAREHQSLLTKRSMKYFSAGLRTNMYGPSSSNEMMKVGIELRDTTRNLDQLNSYIDLVSLMIKHQTWESPNESSFGFIPVLTTSPQYSKKLLKHFIKDEVIEHLIQANDTVALPMMHFERIQNKTTKDDYFDAETRKQMTQARVAYLNDLILLEGEILKSIKETGKPLEKEIVDMAIKISLSEWAKKIKISHIYQKELEAGILSVNKAMPHDF